MYALNLSDTGAVLSATEEEFAAADQPLVETLPEGDITLYDYVNGVFLYSESRAMEAQSEDVPALTQAEINAADIAYLAMMLEVEL